MYRWSVAGETPRRCAICVTPISGLASIALAASMSSSVSFGGRPPVRPARRAAARPAWVRSRIRLRSNSALCGASHNAEFERAMIRERTSAGLAAARAEARVGGRRKKLDAAKRREIDETIISGRKTGAEMAKLYNVSAPTVLRIVAAHRTGLA